ncbi:MAG: hypothetical protein F6K58_12815 [Symploca sp. SIO2E9]|nr:hypothetical protein [Symploca sp. SIO2E9]
MYYLPEPPYFLIVVGLLMGITSGAAFEATLKQKVKQWSNDPSSNHLNQVQGLQLLLPFLGIAAGVCLFLTSGLEVFGFPAWLSFAVSISLTFLIGSLIWSQLGKLLIQLEKGGSRALDLDT